MGVTTILLPRLGETMEEAKVLDWLKAPGQAFRRGEVLLEVETDKTVVEVPALQDGTLLAQLVAPGETVQLDQPIATITVLSAAGSSPVHGAEGAVPPGGAAPAGTQAAARPAAEKADTLAPAATQPGGIGQGGVGIAASPVARRLARRAGVALDGVAGSGRRGRITGADMRAALGAPANDVQPAPMTQGGIALRRVASGGSGAPVILLHGLFDDGRGWRDLPDRLARAGHPVLVPDLPGHGASTATSGDLESMAAALLPIIPEGPVRLVGHSLGAVLATWLAGLLGPRVERLVLLAPAGLGARLNADFTDQMLMAETPAALGRALQLLGGAPLSQPALTQEVDRLRRVRNAAARVVPMLVRGGVQQTDIAADIARLEVPVTAVFGLDDRIVDWRDCASLPAWVAIHLLRRAGHLPQAAAPDFILGLIAAGTRADRRSGVA